MQLCLVRHAIAGERGDPRWPDDRLRPLTAEGAARMRAAARGLETLFVPEAILTSPLVRARETAEILAKVFGLKKVEESDALATGDDDLLFAHLAALRANRVVAVGHEPWMSSTLSNALCGDPARVAVTFRKGAAALVSFGDAPAPGAGRLEWLLQPAALRAAAAGLRPAR